MTTQRITNEEFYKIAPEIKEFSYPDREMVWYKTKRAEVIGIIVVDKIEQTWLGHVWIRDQSGKYPKREMVG